MHVINIKQKEPCNKFKNVSNEHSDA